MDNHARAVERALLLLVALLVVLPAHAAKQWEWSVDKVVIGPLIAPHFVYYGSHTVYATRQAAEAEMWQLAGTVYGPRLKHAGIGRLDQSAVIHQYRPNTPNANPTITTCGRPMVRSAFRSPSIEFEP